MGIVLSKTKVQVSKNTNRTVLANIPDTLPCMSLCSLINATACIHLLQCLVYHLFPELSFCLTHFIPQPILIFPIKQCTSTPVHKSLHSHLIQQPVAGAVAVQLGCSVEQYFHAPLPNFSWPERLEQRECFVLCSSPNQQ